MKKPYLRGEDGTHPFDASFRHSPEGVVERIGGDELSTRTATYWPPGHENAGNGLRAAFAVDLIDDLQALLEQCERIIIAEGWPRDSERDFPDDRTSVPYSDLWYAGKIGSKCYMLLNHTELDKGQNVTFGRFMNIGSLLTDWDWRNRYKDIIVNKLKHNRENRENGKKGGLGELKKARYAALDSIAAGATHQLDAVSDPQKLRLLRKWASEYDRKESDGEPLFTYRHQLLSSAWFKEWLAHYYAAKSS